MRRIFIEGKIADTITITGEDAHHLKNVLRVRKGQPITVVDSQLKLGRFEITDLSRGLVVAKLIEEIQPQVPSTNLILVQSICKESQRMEWIVQKATELGVSEIYPIITERTIASFDDIRAATRRLRWQRVSDAAARQCGRDNLLKVEPITKLHIALTEKIPVDEPSTLFVFCYEEEKEKSLKQNLSEALAEKKYDRVVILIGPEGGFTPDEAEFIINLGGKSSSLGKIIMRVDTAAVAALSILQYELGAFE